MRKTFAAAVASALALAGFAGATHASATIDLIWENTGTNVTGDPEAETIRLNVILTAGPAGSNGASVSVDFSAIASQLIGIGYAVTPPAGVETPLPIALNSPLLTESDARVELINAFCICDLGIGIGLAAGESYPLGFVLLNLASLATGAYEITADVDFPGNGVLNGDTVEISADTTFNSAFVILTDRDVKRRPRWKHNRLR